MADGEAPAPIATPIVSKSRWTFAALQRARATYGTVVVVEYGNGDLRVLQPSERFPRLTPERPQFVYEVDWKPHRSTLTTSLPSRDHPEGFRADISVDWQVVDPAAVVRQQVSDVLTTISPALLKLALSVSATYGIDRRYEAESAINWRLSKDDWLGGRSENDREATARKHVQAYYGLSLVVRVRLSVSEALREGPTSDPSPLDNRWQRLEASPPPEDGDNQAERREVVKGRDRHATALEFLADLSRHGDVSEEDLELLRRNLTEAARLAEYRSDIEPPAALGRSAFLRASARTAPPTYDEVVRRAFDELVKPGRLLFNPPYDMRINQTARVEVRLARTLLLDAELLEGLSGLGEVQLEDIPVAPVMAVTLQGDGFKITAYSDAEQHVTRDEVTTWEFDIKALKRGPQRLVISVSLRIPIPGQPTEHKSIPVREATVDVRISASAAAQFVGANWQWFVGTAIAIGGLIAAIIYH